MPLARGKLRVFETVQLKISHRTFRTISKTAIVLFYDSRNIFLRKMYQLENRKSNRMRGVSI